MLYNDGSRMSYTDGTFAVHNGVVVSWLGKVLIHPESADQVEEEH